MDCMRSHRRSFGGSALLLATCLLLSWGAVTATDKATGDSVAEEPAPAAVKRAPAAGPNQSGQSVQSRTAKTAADCSN